MIDQEILTIAIFVLTKKVILASMLTSCPLMRLTSMKGGWQAYKEGKCLLELRDLLLGQRISLFPAN
jgi:hypothetical protein